ncbi:MAG TPA: alpha/beta hydrolase [Candidatus Limnocylindrales bacterium]
MTGEHGSERGANEATFDDHGSRIRWTERPGPTLARVFIHGLGGNGESILGNLAGDPALGGHRSLLVDLPGHGTSERPDDCSYSLDAHATAVVAVCGAARLDRVDLVGHSLGADIAIVVAYRNPGLVRRLVISEANLDPLPASNTGRTSQAIRLQSEADFVATGYDRLIADNPGWAATLRLCSPIAVHRSAVGLTMGTTPTMREMFVSMSIPRMFIHGDRGEPLLDADGLRAAGIRVVTIPSAGHMMMFDNPPAFVDAVAAGLGASG